MPNILVTGVKGFICSNLIHYLVNKYTEINFIGIDFESYCSMDENISEVLDRPNFIYRHVDIAEREQVLTLFKDYKFHTVINMAAFSHVDRSFINPDDFFRSNVIGTYNVLEVSRLSNVSKFIHMSTDEVYGDKYDIACESTLLNPTNPYSGTKACADQLIISYINGFKFPAIIIRCNNVYGIKQFPEKVIPTFIINLLSNIPCNIHGTGNQKRSFIHIDDFCTAFDIILNRADIKNIYNICGNDDISINELYDLIKRNIYILFPTIGFIPDSVYVEDRKYNDQHYTVSCNKLLELGWTPKIKIQDAISDLIIFYFRKYINKSIY